MNLRPYKELVLVLVLVALSGLFLKNRPTTKREQPKAEVPVDGVLLYLPLDGSFEDSGPFQNSITSDGVTFAPDRFGNETGACRFPRGSSLAVAEVDRFHLTEFTLMAWVKPEGPGKHRNIISKVRPRRDFNLQLNSRGNLAAHIADGPYEFVTSKSVVDTGEWSFVAATFEDRVWTLYINGELVISKKVERPPASVCQSMTIGNLYPGSNEAFHGILDEVRVFDQALSPAEVSEFYKP